MKHNNGKDSGEPNLAEFDKFFTEEREFSQFHAKSQPQKQNKNNSSDSLPPGNSNFQNNAQKQRSGFQNTADYPNQFEPTNTNKVVGNTPPFQIERSFGEPNTAEIPRKEGNQAPSFHSNKNGGNTPDLRNLQENNFGRQQSSLTPHQMNNAPSANENRRNMQRGDVFESQPQRPDRARQQLPVQPHGNYPIMPKKHFENGSLSSSRAPLGFIQNQEDNQLKTHLEQLEPPLPIAPQLKEQPPSKTAVALLNKDAEQDHLKEKETKIQEEKKADNKNSKKKVIAAGLAVCVLASSIIFLWRGAQQKKEQAVNAPTTVEKSEKVNVASILRAQTAQKVKKQVAIPSYTTQQLYKLDLSKPSGATAADLKLITKQGLVGLEDAFIEAEKKYGVNALFLIAIASLESANGTICFKPNNMFGYGSKGYATKEDCIDDVASGIGNNYLKPSGPFYYGKTINDVHKRYASSSTWDDKVARNMQHYYSVISASRQKALKNLK